MQKEEEVDASARLAKLMRREGKLTRRLEQLCQVANERGHRRSADREYRRLSSKHAHVIQQIKEVDAARWVKSNNTLPSGRQTREIALAKPPTLIGSVILRRFLRPQDYERMVAPHIADMHNEYFACLLNRDERGARWAVIRGNLYAVPSWLCALCTKIGFRLVAWIWKIVP